MSGRRDVALIAFAGLVSIAALVAVVVLAVQDVVEPAAALGVVTGVVALGGVALGRLSGSPPAAP